MKLGELTWQDADSLSRDIVVLIPTGSLEQHGPHMPLLTDTLIVTAVAEAVEARIADKVLLTPTVWLGASGHHLAFAGSLSASMSSYVETIQAIVQSLLPHGFHKFYVLNGHGGNTDLNSIAMRELKQRNPTATFGHSGYFAFCTDVVAAVLEGPQKEMRHACESEASLGLHLFPQLVRRDKLRDDGLKTEPSLKGMVHFFDEMTVEGSLGFATLATAEKGAKIFSAAVDGVVTELTAVADGYVLKGYF